MEYLAVLITFLGALVALRGETWKGKKPTRIGWAGLAIVTVGFLASIVITYGGISEKAEMSANLEETAKKLTDAEIQRSVIADDLESATSKLNDAEQQRTAITTKLEAARANLISATSERDSIAGELAEARETIAAIRAVQENEAMAQAKLEAKYSEARGLIRYIVTGTCTQESFDFEVCYGVHNSWPADVLSAMSSEGLTFFDALKHTFSNIERWDGALGDILRYGPERTNSYAAELLR